MSRQLMETQAQAESQHGALLSNSTSLNGKTADSPGLHFSTFLPGSAAPLPLTGFALDTLQHSEDKSGLLGQLKPRGVEIKTKPVN